MASVQLLPEIRPPLEVVNIHPPLSVAGVAGNAIPINVQGRDNQQPVNLNGPYFAGTGDQQYLGGLWCWRLLNNKGMNHVNYPLFMKQRRNAELPAGVEVAPFFLVQRYYVYMRTNGVPTADTNFFMAPTLGTTVGGAMGEGFGVRGDAAATWEWYSVGAGGALTESVTLAAQAPNPQLWSEFVFEFINSTSVRDASVNLWVNGTLVLTRDWVNAPALFLLDGATYDRYVATWFNLLAGVGLYTLLRMESSEYTLDGTRIR